MEEKSIGHSDESSQNEAYIPWKVCNYMLAAYINHISEHTYMYTDMVNGVLSVHCVGIYVEIKQG